MRVVAKKDLITRMFDEIQDVLASGKEVDFIEVTPQEWIQLTSLPYASGRHLSFDGYPVKISK